MDSQQQQETERLKEDTRILKEKAQRVLNDLMELGCSQKPAMSTRHSICGHAKFNSAPYSLNILAARPNEEALGRIQIDWQGAHHARYTEEIARHVHDVLSSYGFSGVSYNLETKTMSILLNDYAKTALEKLDKDLQPLREAIPARTISNIVPDLDHKVKNIPPDEQDIALAP